MALPAGFPDATNTGWQHSPGYTGSLTAYTGATTLDPTANGTTYTNVDFQGLTVGTSTSTVDSITFQGCRFRSSWNTGWNVQVYGTNIKFQYCTFEPLNSQAIPVTYANAYQYGIDIRGASSVTVDHCDIWGFANAVQIEQSSKTAPVVVQNCYIHDAADQDTSGGSGYHHDGFLSNNGGPQYVTITGNTIFSGGNTNAIALQSTGAAYDHITITKNLLGGFGYTVNIGDGYASGDTNVVVTDNTFTTNSPLPAYGPLKITWPSGGQNIWARNKWHNGGNGDPAADGKYWLPNGGQVLDWNNLAGWVSDTDYLAPSNGLTEYRTWPQTNGPATDAADNAAYSMGTEFYSSVDGYVTKIHYYRGSTAVTPVVTGGIFDIATSSLVANSTVTFADPGTTTGWITGTLATPLPITANKHYKAVVLYPNNYTSTSNYWTSGPGISGIVNGILTVPDANTATGGGQQTYAAGTTLAYPNTTFSGGCYWVDVSVAQSLTPPSTGGTVVNVETLQAAMNRLAGTKNMDAQGAANVWIGVDKALAGALDTNPNFESGITGWTGVSATIAADTSTFYKGTQSLKVTATAAAQAYAQSDFVQVTGGNRYTVTFAVKNNTAATLTFRAFIKEYDVNSVPTQTTGPARDCPPGQWVWYSHTFTALSTTTQLRIAALPSAALAVNDSYFVDAATLYAGSPVRLDLVGALNSKAGTTGLGLAAVLNQLAGTQGLEVDGAASRIQA